MDIANLEEFIVDKSYSNKIAQHINDVLTQFIGCPNTEELRRQIKNKINSYLLNLFYYNILSEKIWMELERCDMDSLSFYLCKEPPKSH